MDINIMKKTLLVATFSFVLGVLVMSPLHAMKRYHEELDVKKTKLGVNIKRTNDIPKETKNTDFLFCNTEDIWVVIASLLDSKGLEGFQFTSKFFYARSEAFYEQQNRASGHFQWAEFKVPEKILPKFNALIIRHIRANVDRLEGHPSSCNLEQYNKNYECLDKFSHPPEQSFFKYFLKAQHLHLWKEKLATEELALPPKPGQNSFYRAARQQEQERKFQDVTIALSVLERELINKKDSLFANNPFPLNLNEIGLSYLSFLDKKLVDSEKTEPEKKSITFESYLNELGKNLSPEQRKCSLVKVFTDFEQLNELNGINGTLDDEDTDDNEDTNEYPIEFKGFKGVKLNTLDL